MKNSDCLTTSIAIMKYTGIWMPDDVNYRHQTFYIIFGVLLQIFVFIFIVLAEIAYIFKVMGDTDKTVDAACLLLSHLVQGVKVLVIVCKQRRIKRLIKIIDGPKFEKTDPAKKDILDKTIKIASLFGQIAISAAAVTAVFWSVMPALQTELCLPLKTAYPFDITNQPMFSIMYAYSSISVLLVGIGDAAENYLISGLTVMAAVQLDVLRAELEDLRHVEAKMSYKKTVSCIKYHQNIIEFVDELAKIFGSPIFCQFLTSSVIVCMTVFKITITTEFVEVTKMVFYLICVLTELLLFCFPGDLLINKSLLVADAAYPNNWDGDIRSRKALLLTALRSQRALGITAGGVFSVCLPTAATIVQTSYSYYTMLRHTTSQN